MIVKTFGASEAKWLAPAGDAARDSSGFNLDAIPRVVPTVLSESAMRQFARSVFSVLSRPATCSAGRNPRRYKT